MDEFKGNEPQPEILDISTPGHTKHVPGMHDGGIQVPEEMLNSKADTAYGIPEPGMGTVVQFDSHKDDRSYAAIRNAKGWLVTGLRGKYTWSDLLAGAKDPVIVMQPAQLLHP